MSARLPRVDATILLLRTLTLARSTVFEGRVLAFYEEAVLTSITALRLYCNSATRTVR